jgi:hypothetical protein
MNQSPEMLDIRCNYDYSSVPDNQKPAEHIAENNIGYLFSTTQKASGFFRDVIAQHAPDTRMLVMGGGRAPIEHGGIKPDQLNVDFDPDGFRPLIAVDLNHVPAELFAEPGESLSRAFSRADFSLDDIVDESLKGKMAAVRRKLSEKEIGTVIFPISLQYVKNSVRERLLNLCVASLQEGGSLYVANRHSSAMYGYAEEPGVNEAQREKSGFAHVERVAASWGEFVEYSEYYLAPEMSPKVLEFIGQNSRNYAAMCAATKGLQYRTVPYALELERPTFPDVADKPGYKIGIPLGQHTARIKKIKK